VSTHVETKHEVVICLDCGVPLFQEKGLAVKNWTLFCERCPQPSTTNEKTMPETKKPAHWLDIIPALPPERWGVYLNTDDENREVVALARVPIDSITGFTEWSVADEFGEEFYVRDAALRVNLESPAGFAYGLRLLISSGRPVEAALNSTGAATFRFWLGNTTDADRVDLAKALAEVMS